jgi:hypothetical protein
MSNNILQLFGQPSVSCNTYALWDKTKLNGLYHRIDVTDTMIRYEYPYLHFSNIYVYYKIKIPLKKLSKVYAISYDIKYDILEETVIIRCPNLEYCNALLALILKYVNGEYSMYYIKAHNLINKYLQPIISAQNSNYNLSYIMAHRRI